MLNNSTIINLEKKAKEIRKIIIQMSYQAKSGHMGGSLSCVEILVALYFKIMKVFPSNPENPTRDRLIFSKAHDAKALYAVLCTRGFFSSKDLLGYEKNGGKLPGHTTRHCVPGVEVSAGSLGHGLSMAAGIAYVGKLNRKKYKVFAILSDGECDEGSTWEAILFSGHHKLGNLTAIVDYNKLQCFGFTKDILNLEPFLAKWKSFGWETYSVNGHNYKEIIKVLSNLPIKKNKPTVVIANTIKGFGGPPVHVNQISSQFIPPTEKEMIEAIKELEKI